MFFLSVYLLVCDLGVVKIKALTFCCSFCVIYANKSMAGPLCRVKVRYLGGGSAVPWEFEKGITIGDLYWVDATRHGPIRYPLKVPEFLSEEITHFITSHYEWIRTIFKYLPDSDLRNAAVVCKEWYNVAKIVKENTRAELYWLFWSIMSGLEMQSYIRHFIIRRMLSRPKYCIIFLWTRIAEHTLFEACKPLMSRGSSMLLLPTSRVLGSFVSPEHGHCHLGKVAPAFSLITIPNMPDVAVYQFTVSTHENNTLPVNFKLSWDILERKIGIKKNEIVKGILVFVKEEYLNCRLLNHLLCFIRKEQNHNFAFAGVSFESPCSFHVTPKRRGDKIVIGYIFCGKNVEVTSSVIDENLQGIPNSIARMREAAKDADENVTLMFSAAEENSDEDNSHEDNWYEKYEEVTHQFHNKFKNTPLIGCFGTHTLGLDNFSDTSESIENQKFQHTSNTVLFHLAIHF